MHARIDHERARLWGVVTWGGARIRPHSLNGVPGKGKVLNQLTGFWLRHLATHGLGFEHHMITDDVAQMPESCRKHAAVIGGRSMLVRRLQMLQG